MSDDLVQKTIRIEKDVYECIEKVAASRGQKFPAFINSCIENELSRDAANEDQNEDTLFDMLTAKTNTGFGGETLLEEINRRVAFLQGLTMHLIADTISEDRARLIARSTKDEMNGQEWRRKMIKDNA